MQTKKPYSPPTLKEHGKVVEKTKGYAGLHYELVDMRSLIIDDVG